MFERLREALNLFRPINTSTEETHTELEDSLFTKKWEEYTKNLQLVKDFANKIENAKTLKEKEELITDPNNRDNYEKMLQMGIKWRVGIEWLELEAARLQFKKLSPTATIPTMAHETDLGYDLYANEPVVLAPQTFKLVSTGIACQFPVQVGGIIKDRSSMAMKGIFTHAGVIDPDYRGEVNVLLSNFSQVPYTIEVGNRIAQMVLIPKLVLRPAKEVNELDDTTRGIRGFGSSGI